MLKTLAAATVGLAAATMIAAPAQAAPTDVSGYRSWVASQGVYPSRAVVKTGKSVCAAKSAGISWGRIVRIGLRSGVDTETVSVIMVGAVYELCPWHAASFNRWVNS